MAGSPKSHDERKLGNKKQLCGVVEGWSCLVFKILSMLLGAMAGWQNGRASQSLIGTIGRGKELESSERSF